MKPRSDKLSTLKIISNFFLILAVIFVLFPYIWVILSSFKQPIDINNPTKLFFMPTLDNWTTVLQAGILKNFFISFIVGISTIAISLFVGAPAAYSMSRFKTGGKPFSLTILLSQMIPPAVMVIPLFFLGFQLKISGTIPLIVLGHLILILPLVTWFMISFFADVPTELEDAAKIDGCTNLQAFLKIILPQVLPGVAAAGIFGFVLSWNDMFFSLILGGNATKTLPIAIVGYNTFRGVQLGEMSVAILTAVIPTLIFAFFIQKKLIKGIGGGGVKG